MNNEASNLYSTLKQISDLWPIFVFIASVVGGYVLLRVRVKQLEEKREIADNDLKNLSKKINGFKEDIEIKIEDFKTEVHKNHVTTSSSLARIEGRLSSSSLD